MSTNNSTFKTDFKNSDRLKNEFLEQYANSLKYLTLALHDMGISEKDFKPLDMQDCISVLHHTIVLLSQVNLKGDSATVSADLLSYIDFARYDEATTNLSPQEFKTATVNAYNAYMNSLKVGSDSSVPPIIDVVKTLKPLDDFYANQGQLQVFVQLPQVEQDILTSYKIFWEEEL